MADSLSDILRNKIGEAIDKDVDLLTENSRTEFFTNFCNDETNKKAGFQFAKHRSLFLVQFKKVLKQKGKDPVLYGMSRGDKKEFPRKDIDIQSEISPKPKTVTQKIQNNSGDSSDNSGATSETPETEDEQIELTLEHAKMTCKFMFNIARARFKTWKALDEDEANALGAAWLPILKKYMAKNWGMWGLCLMTTGGIVISRISEDRDKQPPKQQKGKTESQAEGEKLAEAARGQKKDDDRPQWQRDLGVGDH